MSKIQTRLKTLPSQIWMVTTVDLNRATPMLLCLLIVFSHFIKDMIVTLCVDRVCPFIHVGGGGGYGILRP